MTDLEDDVAAALRFRAGEVEDTPCPPLRVAAVERTRRRMWLVPVAAAAAVAVAAGLAGIVLLPGGDDPRPQTATPAAPTDVYYTRVISMNSIGGYIERQLWQGWQRTDEWRQKAVGGNLVKDGRVVEDGSVQIDYALGGFCYPAEKVDDERCTAPGGWLNPTPDFLAGAPRDPETIARQLRKAAIEEETRRTGPGGGFTADGRTFGERNLNYLQLNYLRDLFTANGLPADLAAALRKVVTSMAGIEAGTTRNALGQTGTGYSLSNSDGESLVLIFDADGDYLGTQNEAVVHGMAPALGAPPSKLFN